MFGNADGVAVGDLGDGDSAIDGRLQVDMVGPDSSGDRELEVLRLGDPFGGQVGRPERLGNDDIGVDQLTLEF